MKSSQISEALNGANFALQPKTGIAIDAGSPTLRYSHADIHGSFYVADNYLSATGKLADLCQKVPQSSSDHKGYPVWHGEALRLVLDQIRASKKV